MRCEKYMYIVTLLSVITVYNAFEMGASGGTFKYVAQAPHFGQADLEQETRETSPDGHLNDLAQEADLITEDYRPTKDLSETPTANSSSIILFVKKFQRDQHKKIR
jgi:hypothetical protein